MYPVCFLGFSRLFIFEYKIHNLHKTRARKTEAIQLERVQCIPQRLLKGKNIKLAWFVFNKICLTRTSPTQFHYISLLFNLGVYNEVPIETELFLESSHVEAKHANQTCQECEGKPRKPANKTEMLFQQVIIAISLLVFSHFEINQLWLNKVP